MSDNPQATLNGGALAAEDEKGKITVLRTCEYSLSRFCDQLIEWKDFFAVGRVYADPEPEGHFRTLRAVDGLQKYKKKFPYMDLVGKPVYMEPEPLKRWPSYQGPDHKAEVIQSNYHFVKDFHAAEAYARQLVDDGVAMADLAFIPHVTKVWKQPAVLRMEQPFYRAMISVIWHMKTTSRVGKEREE